jgi:hypothetical protein
MKKIKIVFVIILVLSFFGFFIFKNFSKENNSAIRLKINNTIINLELAESEQEHYLGLSHRQYLEEGSGMLFLFNNKEKKSFVMRDMNFPLDIIFIDDNLVTDVYKNISFEKDKQNILYGSSQKINKALEVNAGFCDKYNIKVGDVLNFF